MLALLCMRTSKGCQKGRPGTPVALLPRGRAGERLAALGEQRIDLTGDRIHRIAGKGRDPGTSWHRHDRKVETFHLRVGGRDTTRLAVHRIHFALAETALDIRDGLRAKIWWGDLVLGDQIDQFPYTFVPSLRVK